jgi:hypothetical protein
MRSIGLQFGLVLHDLLLQELFFKVRSNGSSVSLRSLRGEEQHDLLCFGTLLPMPLWLNAAGECSTSEQWPTRRQIRLAPHPLTQCLKRRMGPQRQLRALPENPDPRLIGSGKGCWNHQ